MAGLMTSCRSLARQKVAPLFFGEKSPPVREIETGIAVAIFKVSWLRKLGGRNSPLAVKSKAA